MERDLPGPACRGRWGWWARWRSRQRRRPSTAPCFPIPPGGKTAAERKRETERRWREKKREGVKERMEIKRQKIETAWGRIVYIQLIRIYTTFPFLLPLSSSCSLWSAVRGHCVNSSGTLLHYCQAVVWTAERPKVSAPFCASCQSLSRSPTAESSQIMSPSRPELLLS